ncbi:16596_t:CDS:10 [Dentiscutata erythropus]|uniref:16596_t:CDS:1 n=1 Tax=Dentiscutata erythropus TaxID=1348616 RepID=A0A9N9G5J9_9GLOM|nr:16596_t:CDS:10 [Dentiscutata erythropus]
MKSSTDTIENIENEENEEFQEDFNNIIKFPPELEASISQILQINDPLDSNDFNPIECLNQMLPNEQALASVDVTAKKLQTKMRQLSGEIKELSRIQTDAGQRGPEEVAEAKKAIEELFDRIRQIKEKASQSETMVQEITKDIKSLDYAKKHLTISITSLKRLQMLVAALDQLKVMAQMKQYKETSQLLQLSSYFKSYKSIKRIAELSSSVNTFQNDLKRQIFEDFESSFSTDGGFISQTTLLANACLVIDIMGLDVRVLKNYDERHAAIFPTYWRLSEFLSIQFCEIVREDLVKTLGKTNELDVKTLLKNLQLTIEFENQLTKRFSSMDKNRPSSTDHTPHNFSKTISTAFEPYLGLYIEAEDGTLSGMVNSYHTETVPDEDASSSVLQSSIDLFYFYRETLANCAKLSTRQPFYDLCNMFAKWLRVYASEVLIGRLPKEERRPITRDELKLTCFIINTADYCYVTTSQLEDKLKDTIDEEYKEKINFDEERNHFLNVVATSIRSLIRGIESSYDPALVAMTKLPWSNLDSVGDQSEYVTLFNRTILSCVVGVHKDITNNRYFRTFCDKFVESFVIKFMNALTKCKPISEVGAEQMLLDVHALKTSLLEMPTMGMENPAPPPPTFIKIVNKGISKVETILKTVLTPHDPPEGLVENYILLIADKNISNFQKILEIKGLKKNEQQPLTEIFQQKILEHPELPASSSIMSSLTSSITSITSVPLSQFMTPTSFPTLLNNVPLTTSSSFVDRSATKFNDFKKVLGSRNWRKKDGSDGTKKEDNKV